VRVFNDRGACLAAARLSDRIRRGVVRLSTGAWFDPADSGSNRPLEKHGNPNALALNIGAQQVEPRLQRSDLRGRDRAPRRPGARGDRA
jgi:biotin/methionine sulfoxide reductase